MRRFAYLLALAPLSLLAVPGASQEPKTRAKIEALEKLLPEYEKAADECEKSLREFAASTDDNVVLSVDGARLRIDSVRSLRAIIATSPAYLTWHLGEDSLRQWKDGMDYFLKCAKSGADPFRGKASGVRTVRSPTDGQILFYVFRLPKGYDPKNRYPLDVDLHSGAALTWRAGWIDGVPADAPSRYAPEDRIWISPCGRGNNSYAGMGEVAVMGAVRDAMRRYPVDPDAVTIGGASMGGTGGFRLAALHPDVFAAAHSLTGGANYSVPVNDGRYDATLLIDNFCNTAMCIWDAPEEGWFKQNRAFSDGLRERAKKYPGSYPSLELTDPKGGHGIIAPKLRAEGWDWIRKQKREPYPKRVVYKTYNLRYDGAYWAYIEGVTDPTAPARIEAELAEGNRVRVAVENVEAFRLDLVAGLAGDAAEVEVAVNGGAALKVKAGPSVHFAKQGEAWVAAGAPDAAILVKKHGLSGPIQDVFMGGPVLMVRGTAGRQSKEQGEAVVDAGVMRLFGKGDGAAILHTPFERKADVDVTAADIADKHLVLFGTPSQNALVKKIADKLPVKYLEDGVEIGGKAYRGDGVGLVMVYPNPLNPKRYVLLMPEQYAGAAPLDLPDFVVVKRVENGGKASQQVLARGTFGAKWEVRR
jgi:pimeloyl-ACP methyl ester carboxylesterase